VEDEVTLYSQRPKQDAITQLVEFSAFMECEGSLLCSQEPTTGPCLKPDKSNPCPHTLLHRDPSSDYFLMSIKSSKWSPSIILYAFLILYVEDFIGISYKGTFINRLML